MTNKENDNSENNKHSEKINMIKDEIFSNDEKKYTKRVSIIFDGKQYNIRIPLDFAKKVNLDPDKDEFEFTLDMSKDINELPALYGDLVEKK